MKLRYKLTVLCVLISICTLIIAFASCSNKEEIEFGDWVTVTAATCESDGLQMRVAIDNPQISQTRAISAIGHDWNEWQVVMEPTCLLDGVETRSCNTCENSDMRAIPALDHLWDEWEILIEPDCENVGSEKRTCLRDENHTELAAVPALGHDYSDWVMTLAPTCTVAGVETRYCRNCNNHTDVRAINPLGHAYGAYVATKAATCTQDGEKTCVCANDASHVKKMLLPALGHSYSDWVVSVAPTDCESGEECRVCSRDATHTEMRVAPALGTDGLYFYLNDAGTEYSVRGNRNICSSVVYIPDTYKGLPVTSVENTAFSSCPYIERVVFLGNNIKTVGKLAFSSCERLQSVEFSEGITSFNTAAFTHCPNLTTINIPASVVSIAKGNGTDTSFVRNSPKLANITVGEGNLAYKVENGCLIEIATNMLILGTVNAVIPDTVTSIAPYAFRMLEIESVNIPANVREIGDNAFYDCDKLREIMFEKGALVSIGRNAFSNCDSLESIELPESITQTGYSVFSNCDSLRRIALGNSLEKIDDYVFWGCNNIEYLTIPASVNYIAPTALSSQAIAVLAIDEDNATYVKEGNCIIEKETNTVISGADNVVIPKYITTIGYQAFYHRKIESVVIPSSVTTIASYAFASCNNLIEVLFEDNSKLEIIGKAAFRGCTKLTGITLPVSLREIGNEAFRDCSSVTRLTFYTRTENGVSKYSGLKIIGSYAFANTGLKSLFVSDSITSIGNNAFACEKLTTVTVAVNNTTYAIVDKCLVEIATGKVVIDFGNNK